MKGKTGLLLETLIAIAVFASIAWYADHVHNAKLSENQPETSAPATTTMPAPEKSDTGTTQQGNTIPSTASTTITTGLPQATTSLLPVKNTWQWTKTKNSDASEIIPKNPEKFILTLKSDGTFSATTDCNGVGGQYSIAENSIHFTNIISTMMWCEGSDESAFTQALQKISSYSYSEADGLILYSETKDTVMYFK